MEPRLRGIIEKNLDELLTDEYLEALSKNYESFKPLIKSKQDAMFGDIVGTIQERFAHYTIGLQRRVPTENEIQEVLTIIERRAEEIGSRILIVTSK